MFIVHTSLLPLHSIFPLMRESLGILMQRTPSSLDYILPNSLQKVPYSNYMWYTVQYVAMANTVAMSRVSSHNHCMCVPHMGLWSPETKLGRNGKLMKRFQTEVVKMFQVIASVVSGLMSPPPSLPGVWAGGCGAATWRPLLDPVHRELPRVSPTGRDGWNRHEEDAGQC